jgi:DNA repair exonuclease SbcCD ATPase subunit
VAAPAAPPSTQVLDASAVLFIQQQLERVLAFMRTVDARLDALERVTERLSDQNQRLTKQLDQRQRQNAPPVAAPVSGGLCPLCGAHFSNSNELEAHVAGCLDRRERSAGGRW